MNAKDFYDRLFSRYLWLHLLAMAAVVVLLCVGVKLGLDAYTHHGERIEVPALKGMDFDQASKAVTAKGLQIVVTDSGYNRALPAYAVLAQSPDGGEQVKEGRVVYVTVNSPASPTVVIPDIIDNSSVREAEARLVGMGFRLMPSQKVSGERDWVYGIVYRGRHVSNGDRLSTDYPLTLLVGRGALDSMDSIDVVDPLLDGGTDEYEVVTEPPTYE